ncbi:hypothetical protein HAX54_000825 [Datura stramonium]|uniref:Uncharacterized protein n=1 Tax=Datura stramonium TaxID=4076 RepID=A0ABS8WU99_DATST|nr:hypothetical protein [Datura stramonium]
MAVGFKVYQVSTYARKAYLYIFTTFMNYLVKLYLKSSSNARPFLSMELLRPFTLCRYAANCGLTLHECVVQLFGVITEREFQGKKSMRLLHLTLLSFPGQGFAHSRQCALLQGQTINFKTYAKRIKWIFLQPQDKLDERHQRYLYLHGKRNLSCSSCGRNVTPPFLELRPPRLRSKLDGAMIRYLFGNGRDSREEILCSFSINGESRNLREESENAKRRHPSDADSPEIFSFIPPSRVLRAAETTHVERI